MEAMTFAAKALGGFGDRPAEGGLAPEAILALALIAVAFATALAVTALTRSSRAAAQPVS